MANKRTYLVTGAAGYLGSEVCRQLLEQNESVRAFVLPNDPANSIHSKGRRDCRR